MPRCAAPILLCATLMVSAAPAVGNDAVFPTRGVTIVVPTGPGGGVDTHMRTLAQQLATQWPHPVVVENRGGADGIVGASHVAKAKPDGYTLLAGLVTLPIVPHLYRNVPYDYRRDLVPVTLVSTTPIVLSVATTTPAATIDELRALLRAQPGRYSYGSSEALTRVLGAQFVRAVGSEAIHVAYKGGGPMLNDLVGGHVAMAFTSTLSALPHAKAGRVRILGVAGPQRTATLPEVATLAEQGIAGFDQDPWYALLAPAGTPPAIVASIQREVARALRSPAMQEHLTRFGLTAVGSTSEAFAAVLDRDGRRWEQVARETGLRPEH
jgi:tripartite-type tricarboxylate transporter receptor subunit TctC